MNFNTDFDNHFSSEPCRFDEAPQKNFDCFQEKAWSFFNTTKQQFRAKASENTYYLKERGTHFYQQASRGFKQRLKKWRKTHRNPDNKNPTPLKTREVMMNLAGGMTSILAYHPIQTLGTLYITNKMQADSWKLKNLYRGLTLNLLNAPMWALMGLANKELNFYFSYENERKLGVAYQLAIASLAGVATTPLATPIDMVADWQRRNKCGFAHAVKQIHSYGKISLFWCGWSPMLLRQWGFGLGMFGLTPWLHSQLMNEYFDRSKRSSEMLSLLLSGIFGGFVSTVITQPSHNTKVLMQAKCQESPYTSQNFLIKEIFLTKGFKGLMMMNLPLRTLAVIVGNIVLFGCREYYPYVFMPKNMNPPYKE